MPMTVAAGTRATGSRNGRQAASELSEITSVDLPFEAPGMLSNRRASGAGVLPRLRDEESWAEKFRQREEFFFDFF